jgi:hypothetical protein
MGFSGLPGPGRLGVTLPKSSAVATRYNITTESFIDVTSIRLWLRNCQHDLATDSLLIATGQTPPVRVENHIDAINPATIDSIWPSHITKVVKL